MSPMMDEMLVPEVVPRLRNAARTIPKVGHEDDEKKAGHLPRTRAGINQLYPTFCEGQTTV